MAWINEFHYDNAGADAGEFIEIAGQAGTDLTGWSIVLYNGNNGAPYATLPLSGTIANQRDGFGTVSVAAPGLQNGSPDGFALVDGANRVVQFLSYEGSFRAVGGPADGLASTDIGIAQSGNEPVGSSLHLVGTGNQASDFTWAAVADDTPGAPNAGQSFTAGETDPTDPTDPVEPPVGPATVRIFDIQGSGLVSDLVNESVRTGGVVTAVDTNGFYLQDATGDGDAATSDAVFVFTGGRPTVAAGDAIELTGTVGEFRPSGAAANALSTTQLAGISDLEILSSGNALPAAVVLGGEGGLLPPTDSLENGTRFYESLEAMRVTLEGARTVAPTSGFGEIFVELGNGTNVSERGVLVVKGGDPAFGDTNTQNGNFHPERIQIDDDSGITPGFGNPAVDTGTTFSNVTGVMGYNFGNFELIPTEAFAVATPSTLTRETTTLVGTDTRLTVAGYNVENLSAVSDPERFAEIAAQIFENLKAPDILSLQEVQDNDGPANTGVVSASRTLGLLADALNEMAEAAGSPARYAFADNPFIGDDTSGGQPGGNIRNAFLFREDRVEIEAGSLRALDGEGGVITTGTALDQASDASNPFFATRLPLVADFRFNGETVTVVNNHFSSKGGSDVLFGTDLPPLNNGEIERAAQAQVVNDFVDSLVAADGNARVVVMGDLNEFQFEEPIRVLTGEGTVTGYRIGSDGRPVATYAETGDAPVLTDMAGSLPANERYTYSFEGNAQTLDHLFATATLADGAQFDVVHINSEFADQVSDHDPVLASFEITGEATGRFQLQILHSSDMEGGVAAIGNAPNFAALADLFEDQFANSITISGGDNVIPGPFFAASADPSLQAVLNAVYNDLYDTDVFTGLQAGSGRIDTAIMNVIGYDASALGNHDFDAGTTVLADYISGAASNGVVTSVGALFPYLSANLDFSRSNLASLTTGIRPSDEFQPDAENIAATIRTPKIAPATIIEENGEMIGVVGATTQLLASLSSPGAVEVIGPDADDMAALAQIIQPTIDALIAQGVNKIVLASHLQQIGLEQALAPLLEGVDVIIASGSHTLLADETDTIRPGDTAGGTYPIVTAGADGNTTLIVSTSSEYSYLGRLVVEFDANGNVVADSVDPAVSGAYASTDEVVAREYTGTGIDPFAAGSKGALVQQLVDGVADVIETKDGNVLGYSSVYLEGARGEVRTEETNFGNLTADANLAYAREVDADVVVSIKNGGGIRASIGQVDPATGALIPNDGNTVSQLDIENSLRFNNALSILEITKAGLVEALEFAFSGVAPGATPGSFPQLSGLEVSFDPSRPAGDRIQSLAIVGADGRPSEVIVRGGELVANGAEAIKIVTLTFLAGGGDGYPFARFTLDRNDLDASDVGAGDSNFAVAGTEQDALAEYLLDTTSIDDPFALADTAPSGDERIQNLAFRDDTVLDGLEPETPPIVGTQGDDILLGTAGDDVIEGRDGDDRINALAGNDLVRAGNGNDTVHGRDGDDTINGGGGNDLLYGNEGNDVLVGGLGDDILLGGTGDDRLGGGAGNDRLQGGEGRDVLRGGAGDDRLWGDAGNDRLIGGIGNDTLWGGEGRDVFEFARGDGRDRIMDFAAGEDRILFGSDLFVDFEAVRAASRQQGTNVVIDAGEGEGIVLAGLRLADLSANDFGFMN